MVTLADMTTSSINIRAIQASPTMMYTGQIIIPMRYPDFMSMGEKHSRLPLPSQPMGFPAPVNAKSD
jgi:hypothetical protein